MSNKQNIYQKYMKQYKTHVRWWICWESGFGQKKGKCEIIQSKRKLVRNKKIWD